MLISHEREKLLQTVVYFAQNTKFCGKVKLFKLLYFLDFEHFKVTGRSVTGLKYSAWKMGPVPTKLFDEIESPEPDFAEALEITEIPTYRGNPMLSFTPIHPFSNEFFTKRELKLLDKLATEYKNTKAEDMIEATHLENLPWDKVFNQQASPQAEIPYEYALQVNEKDEMLKIVRERKEMIEAIG
ncbi:Panacea domain-containing protein [Methylomonas albis]|uniref:SocA family protein n=1 Tax=Methylomonas albis TaxID=1854563 RepID=A0ABR9D192_9GAMM|nr:Panacea domain-containing protein [Methylomonas albis]MBD9356790.1 SocA family protein [Methylomonas albis]